MERASTRDSSLKSRQLMLSVDRPLQIRWVPGVLHAAHTCCLELHLLQSSMAVDCLQVATLVCRYVDEGRQGGKAIHGGMLQAKASVYM